MGYYTPDPYNQPEAFDCTILASIERYSESYSFDFVIVLVHDDGRIFWGADSGCSCPSPFEDVHSLADLNQVESWSELESALLEIAPDVTTGYYCGNKNYVAEVAEVVQKIRSLG